MNAVSLLLVQAVGWALLHFVWKGALIGFAAALLFRLLRDASAQSRYAVGCVALFLCLACPLVDVYRYGSAAVGALDTLNAAHVVPANVQRPAAVVAMLPFMPWLVAAWLAGVTAMTIRLAGGLVWIHRISSTGRIWVDARWQAHVTQLAGHCGIRRKISVRVGADLPGPLTIGWLRPIVLIPAGLLTHLPPDLIDALLAHEVAHIKRFDYLVNLMQGVVEALLFYHPAVWWLSRQIRVERERIADDVAAALIGEPRRLALALQRLSDFQPVGPQLGRMAQWASGGFLLDRIRRLVRPNQRPLSWRTGIPAVALGVAIMGVVMHSREPESARPGGKMQATVASASSLLARVAASDDLKMLADRVDSNHVVVVDDSSGKILLQKNADNVVPIASLTKLMTAMVVLDAKPDMNRTVRIDTADADSLAQRRAGLPVGTRLPLREVMQLALMSSDNRAAYALAKRYPGGLPAFEAAVHAKISALGLSHTTLDEPTGLSPRNTSTARDLAALANAAARYPEITRYTTNASDVVTIKGRPVEYRNTNPFVGQEGWDIKLSKTGFTDEAGRCLIMRIDSGGKVITMVLLNAQRKTTPMHDAITIRQQLLASVSRQG